MKQTIELNVVNGNTENYSLNVNPNKGLNLYLELQCQDNFIYTSKEFEPNSKDYDKFDYYMGLMKGVIFGRHLECFKFNNIDKINGKLIITLEELD